MERIDPHWLQRHPLPCPAMAADKNGRGRVLVVGGAEFVPGALRLTGEGALRAGAGKLQMATVRAAAMSLGVLVPEAAMTALPSDADGEIAAEAGDTILEIVAHVDTLILGPGMSTGGRTVQLVERVLANPRPELSIVLDAAALACLPALAAQAAAHQGRLILTPHPGEMALLMRGDRTDVAADPVGIAQECARRYGAVVVLKDRESLVAGPGGELLHYRGGGVGLATSGSGDVLAGIIGGLCARGAPPTIAGGWGCWLHGEAGRRLAENGEVGFLAREISPLVPRLLMEAVAGSGRRFEKENHDDTA